MKNKHILCFLSLLWGLGCASFGAGPKGELMSAVVDDDASAVRKALAKKPNLDLPDERGAIPLITAATRGKPEIVQLLLDAGAAVDVESYSYTPLNCAAQDGHVEIVKMLIKAGANIDYQVRTGTSMKGKTALMAAASRNRIETAKALIEAKANVTLRNQDEETAYDIAKKRGHEDLAILLKEAEKKASKR